MTIEVPPTRVPGGRLPARLALGAFTVGLAMVVAAAVLGRGSATSRPIPSPSAAEGALATVSPRATALPSSSPAASPTPREVVPTVTEGTVAMLSEPSAPVSTGIETLSPSPGYPWRVVADADGDLWAIGGGRLTRYDPAIGTAWTWTVDDDARFVANDITPSAAGGVWLVGTRTLRRFDGAGFREAVGVGAGITAAVEASDLTLWAATDDGSVVHLAGTSRTTIGGTGPRVCTSIVVDAAGRLWCRWALDPGAAAMGVARYDGSTWRFFDGHDAPALGGSVSTIAESPDGSIVVASDSGLAHFDGFSWIAAADVEPPLTNVSSVATGPDGSLWAASSDADDGTVVVGRLDGRTWTLFGPDEGLPPESGMVIAWMVPAKGRVLVGTGVGIYELTDARWQRVWPTASGPGPEGGAVLPVSRDEAWVAEGAKVWHFLRGTWSDSSEPLAGGYVRGLLRTADGTLWAAEDDGGLYLLRGTTSTRVGKESAGGLAADGNGLVCVTGNDPSGPGWLVRSYGFDGRAWVERSRTASTDLVARPWRLAIGRDRAIWAASRGDWGVRPGLVRYAGGSWEMVQPLGATAQFDLMDLAVAANGDVWVVGAEVSTSGGASAERTLRIARFDGTRWSVFGQDSGLAQGFAQGVAAAPDGAIWVATDGGLARFDGTAWTTRYPGIWFSAVSVTPDGTVWANGPSGVERLTASARLRSGPTMETTGPAR